MAQIDVASLVQRLAGHRSYRHLPLRHHWRDPRRFGRRGAMRRGHAHVAAAGGVTELQPLPFQVLLQLPGRGTATTPPLLAVTGGSCIVMWLLAPG